MDTIEVYKDDGGQWRWRKLAEGNEANVASSGESFDSQRNAVEAANREAEGTDARVEVVEPSA